MSDSKRNKQFSLNCSEEIADLIKEKANKDRRAPSEWLYLVICDYLAGVIK